MLGAAGVCGDVGQVEVGLKHAGQLNLGHLHRLSQALHGHGVAPQVHAGIGLELFQDIAQEPLVHIPAAQLGVA